MAGSPVLSSVSALRAAVRLQPIAAPKLWGMHMTKMSSRLLVVLLAASSAFAAPVRAQESSYAPGAYWEVSMVDVEDGQEENYIDFLADQWKKSQEFAKSKGYIRDYHVLANSNARKGEPDLYLIVEFDQMYDTKEQLRQQKEFEAFMKRDARQLTRESGERVTMRKLSGSMLLRELELRGAK